MRAEAHSRLVLANFSLFFLLNRPGSTRRLRCRRRPASHRRLVAHAMASGPHRRNLAAFSGRCAGLERGCPLGREETRKSRRRQRQCVREGGRHGVAVGSRFATITRRVIRRRRPMVTSRRQPVMATCRGRGHRRPRPERPSGPRPSRRVCRVGRAPTPMPSRGTALPWRVHQAGDGTWPGRTGRRRRNCHGPRPGSSPERKSPRYICRCGRGPRQVC